MGGRHGLNSVFGHAGRGARRASREPPTCTPTPFAPTHWQQPSAWPHLLQAVVTFDVLFTDPGAVYVAYGCLQNELWFDPDPVAQQAVVPGDKTDARSVVLHEFGHAFGFSGWRNGNTGALPGDFASTFDNQVQAANDTLSFIGANAVALHGCPLAVTAGNDSHLGNDGGDALLLNDLMNGAVFYRGSRYQISAIDLAVMQDIGLPLAPVPEPASWALMALGLLALRPLRRAARR